MIYREETRDLFQMPQGYYLAHCISADFGLGAGIATQFNKYFDMKNKLLTKVRTADVGEAIVVDNVFNLVTKEKYYQKPTYDSLKQALIDMKMYAEELMVTKIAMPKIGCGLDRLEWSRVKEIIFEVFAESDIEIVVCVI